MKRLTDKTLIFEMMKVPKALFIMSLPAILSQIIILIYNLADTYFIGKTNNTFMVGAVSLVLAFYLMLVVIANIFGVGGGSLITRLLGANKLEEARKVGSYTIIWTAIVAISFSLLSLALMEPILKLLGASEDTIGYAKQYTLFTIVIGGLPTVLAMMLPMLIRSVGYSKESSFGIIIGALLNIGLDPLFMFVIFPKGKEVMGAGIATMISNFLAATYFIILIVIIKNKTVLSLPKRFEKLEIESYKSFFMVGVPAGLIMLLFNIVSIIFTRIGASYSDSTLAAIGIILKIERIPLNITLGVCLGMVPCVAYNYAKKDYKRMDSFFYLSLALTLLFTIICMFIFFFLAETLVSIFIKDEEVISIGVMFLKARSFYIPFMAIGFVIINYTQAINHGKESFLLTVSRHLILSIPLMLILNFIFGISALSWSQLIADILQAVISILVFVIVRKNLIIKMQKS